MLRAPASRPSSSAARCRSTSPVASAAAELGVLGLEAGHVVAQTLGGAEELGDGDDGTDDGGGAALDRAEDLADGGADRVDRGVLAAADVEGDRP